MEALHPYLIRADQVLVVQLPEFGVYPHEYAVEVIESGDAAFTEFEVVKEFAQCFFGVEVEVPERMVEVEEDTLI